MNSERFSILTERHLDREATPEELAELQACLRSDADARDQFWQAAEWHALYRQWGEQEWGRAAAREEGDGAPQPTPVQPRRTPRSRLASDPAPNKIVRFPFARWAAGIAAVAAVVLWIFSLQSRLPIATLERVAGASWTNPGKFQAGTRLKRGTLQLERGFAIIAFDRGARVIIEGPAEFELRDNNHAAMRFGRLRARVPSSAHGFRVETPQFTAVDLGTEFGCEVSIDGAGELHVFDGKVNLLRPDESSPGATVNGNEAMRIDRDLITPTSVRSLSFPGDRELDRADRQSAGDFLGAWRLASQSLAEFPATELHYVFETNPIVNQARKAPAGSNAQSFGTRKTDGRWPGKGAVVFTSAEDRLQFALPGKHKSLTLLAWVRVASLQAGQNPLVMSHALQGGAVHWYLYANGGLGVGVSDHSGEQADWKTFHSEPGVLAKHFNSWIFVATVLDGNTGTATHYLNGEPVGSRGNIVRTPLQLNSAEIGGQSLGRKPGDPAPRLDGAIDELAIFSTALAPEEISRLHQQGKTQILPK